MSRKSYKIYGRSKISTVLNFMIIAAGSAVIILFCMYLYKYINEKENNPGTADAQVITVITETAAATTVPAETKPAETATTVTSVTETVSVTENEIIPPPTDYDKLFFSNIMFIGDSIATGLAAYEFMPPGNVFAQVGLNPDTVLTHGIPDASDPYKTEKTAVQKAVELEPEYICVMLGTNGLAYLNNEYSINKMTLLIEQLAEFVPDSKIILITIPPVTKERETDNPEKLVDIIDYNSRLKNLADDKDCYFVDIFSLLQDETGYFSDDYAETDGLHFKDKAYRVMLHAVQEELGKQLTINNGAAAIGGG